MRAQLAKLSEGLSIGKIADAVDKTITQAVKKHTNIKFDTLMQVFAEKGRVML